MPAKTGAQSQFDECRSPFLLPGGAIKKIGNGRALRCGHSAILGTSVYRSSQWPRLALCEPKAMAPTRVVEVGGGDLQGVEHHAGGFMFDLAGDQQGA